MLFERRMWRNRSIHRSATLLVLFSIAFSLAFACALPFANSARMKIYDPSLPYVATEGLGLGTNLAGIADWSTQLPLIDGFKSARRWITQCSEGSDCTDIWDTEEYDQLDLDEHGWVKSLPTIEDAPRYSQVSTLLYREIDRYPGGTYVVLYKGEGNIDYSFDAKKDEAQSRPGRDVINVTPSNGGILMVITQTDPNKTGNYIRDIHVVPIEYENTYETEIFNPLFLERIKKFGTLRFMDWMLTNNSNQGEWANRPTLEDATYAEEGVPLELMIELANRLRAHPWFNMPHQATDEYMRNFAQLVKEKLDPNLKVYVELSNEVWNWMFQQAQYALRQGHARWGEDKGDAFMQWYGMRTAQMSDIWKQVFSGQQDRVISVISSQTAWLGLETSVLDCPLWVAEGNKPCFQHQIDAYAITAYFSGNLSDKDNQATIETWADQGDQGIDQAMTQMQQGGLLEDQSWDDSVVGAATRFDYHQQVAKARNLKLIVYEGGQHLVNPDSSKLTDFFIGLNRNPKMYDLYQQLLNSWKQSGGELFMNFSDIGQPSKWGSWGVLEHVDQENGPKYDALIDFIDQNQLR
jgi:hypothetical protein